MIMGSLASEIGPIAGFSSYYLLLIFNLFCLDTYAASKAAVQSMAATWRTQLKTFGVGVTLIQPGFVKTPLTDKNDFYMPLMIDSEQAAQVRFIKSL